MSVICATNFTPQAAQAATAAARLAVRRGTPLWLVHAAADTAASGLQEAARALQTEARRLTPLGTEVREALLQGPLPEVLLPFAQDKRASHIVVGAPRQPPTLFHVSGSLDPLVQRSPVPLMLVRDAAPFEAWTRGQRPLKVVLGMDRSEASEAARGWVAHLAGLGPLELTVVHVFWPPHEYERLGLPRPLHLEEQVSPELQRRLEHEVTSWMAGAVVQPTRVRLVLGPGRTADHLLAMTMEQAADLLVMGTHRRRGMGKLWSSSHHVLRLSHLSVVLVPAEARPVEHEAVLPGYREVLVATDFSALGNRAIPHACAVVAPGGTVHLVHVGEARASAQQRADLQARLGELFPPEAARQGKHCSIEVLAGADVAATLVQAAERLDVDALCLSTRGRPALSRAVLGSVAHEVVKLSQRPVLLVPTPGGT